MCLMFHDISRGLLNLQVALLEEFNPVLSSCNFLCSLLSCKSVNFVLVANSMCSLDRNGVKWVPDGDELLRKVVPSVQPDRFLGNCTFELVEFVQNVPFFCNPLAIMRPWAKNPVNEHPKNIPDNTLLMCTYRIMVKIETDPWPFVKVWVMRKRKNNRFHVLT